ncbi:MAG: MOSC domain-containing protein [Proteobacteria bacterium]|nr:MOSC domain-containing protein [Pseudomonadota bacterium]
MTGETIGRILEIRRYPVKSLGGESMAAASLLPGDGIAGDRAFVLHAPETGAIVQASRPRDWPGAMDVSAAYIAGDAGAIRYTLPDGTEVASTDPAAADLLAKALGRPVTLVESAEVGRIKDGDVHLLTTASLAAMAALHPEGRFETRRFRPSLVIESPAGAQGFVENDWVGRRLRIGDAIMRVSDRTVRCVLPTLAQGDLPKDPDILRTVVKNNGGDAGIYAMIETPGRIRVGDDLLLEDAAG